MNKKDGGTLKLWQLHTLSDKYRAGCPECADGPIQVLTGTVVDDPTGRWIPGYHMRSSFVVKIEDGVAETLNTMYKLEGPEGDPTFGNEDIGDLAAAIFY